MPHKHYAMQHNIRGGGFRLPLILTFCFNYLFDIIHTVLYFDWNENHAMKKSSKLNGNLESIK